MEDFARLFGGLLTFAYHCFDRIVIRGHLPLLTRPENIVHFFRDVHGVAPITKEVLRQRSGEYQALSNNLKDFGLKKGLDNLEVVRRTLAADLRKMKAHGLLQREGRRYAYRLTDQGTRVALLFVLFHKRVCGPLANSLFHRPVPSPKPLSQLEAAYHKSRPLHRPNHPTAGCLNY